MKLGFSKTQFALLFSLGFMGAAFLMVFGLVYVIESDAEQLRTKAAELAFQKAQAEEQFETTRLLEDTQEERNRLADFVLTEQTIIDFISEIETIATSQQLDFDTQTIAPKKTKHPTFDDLTISFGFSGAEDNVWYMIKLFESLPYHSHIQDIDLSQNSEGNWSVRLLIHITILEYEE